MRATLVIAALGFAAASLAPARATAQSSTTGAIQGQVLDDATGDTVAGVTIVASSAALQTPQTTISDDSGFYKISELPPGSYLVTFYFAQLTVQRSGVNVGVNKTTPVFQRLKLAQAGGEVVKITDTAPAIDPTSTTQGMTLDQKYLKNVPNPGLTFDTALGGAAGSQNDGNGIAFSGSSSLENQYFVDGLNTTGLTYGNVGTPVINNFIEEIEVVTGGYNAEYGRATGAVVNVVTKTGTNEFRGSVFGSVQPGLLTAPAVTTPVNASSIDATANNAYIASIGAEVGGPIIKDKLWYYVGFAPQFDRTDITRTTKRQTDCRVVLPSGKLSGCDPRHFTQGGNADTFADVDPATGFYITDTLDSEIRSDTLATYNLIGKLNYAPTATQQGQITLQALPRFAETPTIYGLASTGTQGTELTSDLSAKWTSKFNDGKTQVETVVGWHRDHTSIDAIDPAAQNQPLQGLRFGSLGTWGRGFGGESQKTIDGCFDSSTTATDAYPSLATNCPMDTRFYYVGGPGAVVRNTEQRLSASAAVIERVKALGSHEIKAGLESESNTSDKSRLYSGGAFITNFVRQGFVEVNRWVQLKEQLPPGTTNMNTDRFDNTCQTDDPTGLNRILGFSCDYLGGTPGDPGTEISGNTFNWSAYLRDSWQILPNFTVNLGLRYEEQRLRYAEFLRHTTDPLTKQPLGKNAMSLQNMWAPRIGAIYDWTQEGRSKVYAHWGRFYESIPMDINDRAFGGEVSFVQAFRSSQCRTFDNRIMGFDGAGCLDPALRPDLLEQLVGASGVLIAPGIKPQYLDELVVGAEYEVLDDLKVGLSYQNRKLGRVIEDVSTDGANTYLIANPGEWSAEDEARLSAQIARTENAETRMRLEKQLALFQGIRMFDKPRRDYNAVQLTATRRFSKQLYLQGSYTYSRTIGNYPGLISYDNGQIDPNISSQYDLIELLANREGPLPQDRPHSIKLDGYYTFDLKRQGALTVGARVRAFSGIPRNALASHNVYGTDESFLLPRGALGRSDFDHGIDLHLGYTRSLSKSMDLTVYVDVFNVYDHQGTAQVDNTYAPPVTLGGDIQNANPISGGSYEDLIWAKQIDNNGNEQNKPIGRNPNFGNATRRYAPALARIGASMTF